MALLKGRKVIEDTFVQLTDGADPLAGEDIFVSLPQLQELIQAGKERQGKTGLQVSGDVDPEELVPYLSKVDAIAVEIPRYTDGRAYSTARLLRDRYGYRGELRAVGHVLRDQLLYLERCGFDAFSLAPGQSVDDALEAFAEFSVFYQPGAKTVDTSVSSGEGREESQP